MATFKSDRDIIRDYVMAKDHLQYTQLPEGVVCILMTHSNLPTKHMDIRLDLHMTIEQVKEKFRNHTGTPVEFQRLLLRERGNLICELTDNSRMLGFYSVASGMEIHILDVDPYSLSRGGGLTDTSLVEKYKMSEEAYDSRKGTMREYIRQQRELNPNFKLKPNAKASADAGVAGTEEEEVPGPESVQGFAVGMRCEVSPGARRGTVMFLGEVDGLKSGHWVGVIFDEPVGRSNGVVKGQVIFECQPNYGGFVRGKNTKVGDYPERDIMDEFEDEQEADATNPDGDEDEI